MNINFSETIKVIKTSLTKDSNVVIFGHVNPDGDAVGSTLGLYHFLKLKVTDTQIVMPNDFPEFLKWLPGQESIICFDKFPDKVSKLIERASHLFFCDFNDPKRVEKVLEGITYHNKIRVLIDHHPQPVDFVDYMISDTSVSSTAELVYEFIENISGENFSHTEIATCLLTGIITDTGLFHHNSDSIRTFEIVANLIKMGANKSKIIDKLYNEYPYSRMQLLGNTLHNRLRFFPEYSTSYLYLTKEDLVKYNYQNGDSEGFVNMALSIAGANFTAIFIEKEDHVKVSFRSSGNFDVNEFARKHFNGGGHRNAAGGKSYQPLNKTLEIFVELAKGYRNEIHNS